MDIIKKRALGRKKVFEEDWVPAMRKAGLNLRVASIYIDEAFVPDMALRKALDMVSAMLAEERYARLPLNSPLPLSLKIRTDMCPPKTGPR